MKLALKRMVHNMINGSLDIYDVFELKNEGIVTTTLYNLAPVTNSGKDAESLSSYLIRLADLHCIRVGDLFNILILPKFSNPNKEYFSPQINGHGILATETIKILEKLTGRGDLEKQTLLRFQDVLSKIKLFKTHKAWCPVCLNKMKNNSEIIYEKIIWNINEYTFCLEHLTKLENICENCGKYQSILPKKGRNGFCHNCQNWLGKDISLCQQYDSKIHEECIYNSVEIGKILTHFFNETNVDYEKLHHSLITINKILPKTILLRELDNEMSYTNFLSYTSKKTTPTIKKLLKISWKLKIDLVDILINEKIENKLQNKYSVKNQKKFNYSVHSYRIKSHLEEALQSPKFKSVNLLAKELGVCTETLRNNFPELIRKVKEKNNKISKPKATKVYYNHQKDKIRVEKYLNQCLGLTEPISLEEISNNLLVSVSALNNRFPILMEKIKNNNKSLLIKKDGLENNMNIKVSINFDLKEVKEKLLNILESINNKPVYIKDIAKNIGISDGRLRRNYKDIIIDISKKNKEIKIKNQENYYLKCKNRLIDTIFVLWHEGIYPGVETLQKHLDFCVNHPKHLHTWREMLNELGIEKRSFFKT